MILSITVSLLGTNAASANPPSNGVSYNKNGQVTVQNALDNLYSKANYGNATSSDILKGKKALVGGKEVVGTYEAPSLSSLTPGDVTPEDIIKGKIAWVNGKRIVGTKVRPLVNQAELGSYIKYQPSQTSYSVANDDTGYHKGTTQPPQSVNPSSLNVWRVIRKNDDGTVDIVSANVSNLIYFVGRTGYSRFIETLNKIASAYETEGITVGSRHMGYNSEATDTENGAYTCYQTDVDLVTTACGTLLPETNRYRYSNYWLASRGGEKDGCKGCYGRGYRVHSVWFSDCVGNCEGIPDGEVRSDYLVGVDSVTHGSKEERIASAIRPIVVLKADLKIVSGKGTSDSPYILGEEDSQGNVNKVIK